MFSVWPQVKQSKIASGFWIPALSPARLVAEATGYVPVLARNPTPERRKGERDVREWGGRFWSPVSKAPLTSHSA